MDKKINERFKNMRRNSRSKVTGMAGFNPPSKKKVVTEDKFYATIGNTGDEDYWPMIV